MKRNVLVLGGGGREHVLCWKLSQSKKLDRLHCIPGNAGIEKIALTAPDLSIIDFPAILNYVQEHQIDLIVVGPEQPLVSGAKDFFEHSSVQVFGPNKMSAQLEGSKIFTKNLFSKHEIPTPSYQTFFSMDDALYHIRTSHSYPLVIKADGLASGKGVYIAENEQDAVEAIKEMMEHKKFKSAGEKIVIEEFINGKELSYQIILNGKHYAELLPSQDFKKALDGDKGPNTGGMGNVCPPAWMDEHSLNIAKETIIQRLVNSIQAEGIHFSGVLFIGMIISEKGPSALEINVRFGDPEVQSILPLLKTDFMDLIEACLDDKLDQLTLEWNRKCTACVVLASKGYPTAPESGKIIEGLEDVERMEDLVIFHAGTVRKGSHILTNGGRVLNIVGFGDTPEQASAKAYEAIQKIHFPGMHYRKDIR